MLTAYNGKPITYDAIGNPISLTYDGARYTYDAWGNSLTTTGTLASSVGYYNPLRYRGYVYDTETQLYYLQSRYYNPRIGRFINADGLAATGQGFVGNNMFAYCSNNPIIYKDSVGKWTMGISVDTSLFIGLGVSVSIGIFWDDNGNCEVLWSYSVPWVNDTMTFGALAAGGGVSFQYTNRDTVHDLYGLGTTVGASAGPTPYYAGCDLVTFDNIAGIDASIHGGQVNAGFGIGIEGHISKSNTQKVCTFSNSTNKVSTSSNSTNITGTKYNYFNIDPMFQQHTSGITPHISAAYCCCFLCKNNII